MDARLADSLRQAATLARRRAANFVGPAGGDDLPWAVIAAFDADIRGSVERDRQIEDERDRVLIAAVKLADARPEDDRAQTAARDHLVAAIDYLEQAVLRFGIISRHGAKRGFGTVGQPVGAGD